MTDNLILYNLKSSKLTTQGSYRVATPNHRTTQKSKKDGEEVSMPYRKKTRFPGVYERVSQGKIYKGAPDTCFDITYKHNNKKVWEKVGWLSEGYSAKLAADIRAERMRAMRHGQELPKQMPKTLFKHAAERYLAWAKDNRTKGGRDEENMYRKHLSARFDTYRLDGISSFHLERMKNELLKEGYAPATVKHALVMVRQIYNKAIADGSFKGINPIKGVKMPKLHNQRERYLTYEEAQDLLRALKLRSEQVHDLAAVSLSTGMRFGELAGLHVHDIDFGNELISITDPKNNEPRKMHMTTEVKAIFRARISSESKSNDLVFHAENGEKMVTISKTFFLVVDALGFNKGVTDTRQKVCFHTLRHSFASWLALQGETIQTISQLLGHKSLELTMRYSHLSPDHRKMAIKRLESTINGRSKVIEIGRDRT